MNISLRVLVPEGTTNYILNPAIRYNTDGWTANGSTLTRVLTYSRFGVSSLKVATSGNAIYEGAFYRVSSLTGINDPITASIYARGNQGNELVRIRLIENPFGNEWVSRPVALKADRWTRLEVSGFLAATAAGNDVRLYVETASVKAVTFYLDGAQIERKAYGTTFCDGDQPGCRWNLEAHNSVSTRDPYTRAGGKWVALAGPCRETNDLYVTVLGGMGMPPMEHRIQSWAKAPGSFFQDIKIRDRVMTFSFFAKHKNLRVRRNTDLSPLHELRQQLIDLIKPDKTAGHEPFLFEYDAGDRPLYIRMRYEAGLEGDWDIRNGWVNSFPVRFMAVDPIFTEDNQNDTNLNFLTTIGQGAFEFNTAGRINGVWSRMPVSTVPGIFSIVYTLAIGKKGEIYAGGSFSGLGLNYLAKWNGSAWSSIGDPNGVVYAMAVAPNGDLYITGDFTSVAGVAATRIAKYTASTGTWSALSTGLNSAGRAIVVAPNGQVYVGGEFTTAGGTTVNRIARWDGTQFRVVGTPAGVNNTVRALVLGKDGNTVYMGGDFTFDSGVTINIGKVASINITTNLISVIGDNSGFNGNIYAMAVGPDGTLYVGGTFTSSSSATLRIAQSRGYVWSAVGDGFANGTVYSLSFGRDGTLYIGGDFTLSGTLPTARLAKWVNNVLYPVDFIPAKVASPIVYSLVSHPNGDLYLGMDNVTTASYASAITTVNNSGTTEVKPILYVVGSGTLRYIENQNTGKKVHLNLQVFSGEEIFIDFQKGTIYSLGRGDLSYAIVNPSDLSDFSLIPGDNLLAAFMTDDVGASMKISYVPQHWSADAVVDAEALQ